MRYLRAKHVRKTLQYFQINYNIKSPYKVLLDGNFLSMGVQMKIELLARLTKMIQCSSCRFFVPQCVINELKLLGNDFSEALKLALKCKVLKDEATPSSVADAIVALVGDQNSGNYIVCTQDTELRSRLRKIAGVPLIYLNRSVLVLEDPSEASKKTVRKLESSKLKTIRSSEKIMLKKVKPNKKQVKQEIGLPRIKIAKGPNPLSCKKTTKPKVRTRKKVAHE